MTQVISAVRREAEPPPAPEFTPPPARMAIAVLAMIGLFVAGYLALYKMGYIGVLQCGVDGGCSTVQASSYSLLLGIPVALWGLGAYAALLVLALLGLQPRWAAERWIALSILGIAAIGVAFSAYLTYLSGAVIGAYCAWCVTSAILISLIFLCSLPGLRFAR